MAVKKKMPERVCVGCQKVRSKKELIRIVRSPDGEFSIDTTGKKSGRGAYICPNKECLETAIKGHKLEKSFKSAIDSSIYDKLRAGFSNINE
ncbi:RNase P modulator RnpM [Pectinatus sottacetonis]|uniref:RNase P modulator RnpM n=1 Tax=Pectinatus sottacetonis TaxID=1002795 RepID=UPI0018C7D6BA|nr:YlxR family protein [Pectinatus sottacetonis]